jgi:hypothetical protein
MKKIITLFLVSLVTTTLMAAPQGRVLKTDKVLNKTELKRLPVKKGNSTCSKAPAAATFDITVSNIKASSFSCKVVPSDLNATYYYTYIEKAYVEGATDEQLVSDLLIAELDAIIELYKEYMGITYTYADLLYQGVDEYDYTGLTADTEYLIVAAYMDVNGKASGSVVKQTFKTSSIVMSDLTFQFAVTSEGVTVIPSNDTDPWDYCFILESEFAEYYNNDADALAQDMYAYYGDEYAEPGQCTFTYAEMLEAECQPGTYVLVVWGANEGVNSKVATCTFELGASQGVEQVATKINAVKQVVDGQLVILKNGVKYNAIGSVIK